VQAVVQEVITDAATNLDTALSDQWEAFDDEPFEATMNGTKKAAATITRRRRRAKLPSYRRREGRPLHSGFVELLDLGKIMSRMNDETVNRFRHLLERAFSSDVASVPAKVSSWAGPLPETE
jgi:hypothetical protein